MVYYDPGISPPPASPTEAPPPGPAPANPPSPPTDAAQIKTSDSLGDFISNLGQNDDQKKLLDNLTQDPDYQKLKKYLDDSPSKVKYTSQPGLVIGGVERFGGYNSGSNTLIINPTKPEHVKDPKELIITVVHELLHVSQDLRLENPDIPPPIPKDIYDTSTDPTIQGNPDLKGQPLIRKDDPAVVNDPVLKKYLDDNYGDSDSNPKEEYKDLNKKGQKYIDDIVGRITAK